MQDVTFSGSALALIGTLGGLLLSAIGLLFRELLSSKNASLADMTAQRNLYQSMAAKLTDAFEESARARTSTTRTRTHSAT